MRPYHAGTAWIVSIATIAVVAGALRWVDLSPRVEADFFFSRDDPQLLATREVSERFPSAELVVVRVEGESTSATPYRQSIEQLTEALGSVDGVTSVNSITTEDAARSPLWGPLLLNSDGRSSNLLVQLVSDVNPERLVGELDVVLAPFESDDLAIQVSGVPYIIELIRRNLFRDLVVFSSAALLVFGLIIGVVYRRIWLVVGTLATCLLSISITLVLAQVLSIGIGLLTANIAVIVFVLTLSHTVFLAANWRRGVMNGDTDPTAYARRETVGPSFWAMLTTLLGFTSLLLATAKPLRELGIAGAVGALTALVIAYGVFPVFLRAERTAGTDRTVWAEGAQGTGGIGSRRVVLGGLVVGVLIAGLGFRTLTTDPSLLSYFDPDGPLYEGLEAIDRDGGSSPLNLVIREPGGMAIGDSETVEKMWTLHESLESDAAVGSLISPALLLNEARRAPMAGFLSNALLLELLQGPFFGRVGLSYVTADQMEGRFFLRMREGGRVESRQAVLDRVERYVTDAELEPVYVAGQYELQLQLGRLIRSSLAIGLGGLLMLFVGVAAVVSRDGWTTLVMVLCLTSIPIVVLGVMGHLAMPVDIIASPAANVALAMGVDSMIHLVMRVRKLGSRRMTDPAIWVQARRELWQPIVGAAAIISVGFGIFGLSSFPPTQRFGIAVIVGTLMAATLTLIAVPRGATLRRPKSP